LIFILPATAQDVFNSNSGANDCDSARAGVFEQYSQKMREIERERRELTQRTTEKNSACGSGDSTKPCHTKVADEYSRENENLNQRGDRAGLERDNAISNIEGTVCAGPAVRSGAGGGADRFSGTTGGTSRGATVPRPPDGRKGIFYEPLPQPNGNPQPPQPNVTGGQVDLSAMIKTMDVCLQERGALPKYSSPPMQAYSGRTKYSGSTVYYDPAFLGRQKPLVAAFWVASAYAAHVVSLERQQSSRPIPAAETQADTDKITGWLTGCLVNRGVLPPPENQTSNDPRFLFTYFLGQNDAPMDGREENFSYGFHQSVVTTLTLGPILGPQ